MSLRSVILGRSELAHDFINYLMRPEVAAVPLTLICALVVLNQWVGYYPSVQRAWADLTVGPVPDQIDAKDLPGLRNTHPDTGKVMLRKLNRKEDMLVVEEEKRYTREITVTPVEGEIDLF